MEKHLTVSEAAKTLNRSRYLIGRYCREGRIRAIKPGNEYLIPASVVNRLQENWPFSVGYPKGKPRHAAG